MKIGDRLFGILQNIGRSFMLPIALLPMAGLCLGIGASFTNPYTLSILNLNNLFGNGTIFYSIFIIMSMVGEIIFKNLPIIFTLGVAMGLAKHEKGVASLSALISYLTMNEVIHCMLLITKSLVPGKMPTGSIVSSIGIVTLDMGVFGGILVGLLTSVIHNKFYKTKLPDYLSFFGGVRFVPIVSSLIHIFLGLLMFYLWPSIQNAMHSLSMIVSKSGYVGTFLFGVIERGLIPFGLHHIFYMPFWQTAVGGTVMVDKHLISGAQNIFFAELASSSLKRFSVEATRFFTGKFPFMIFGLPGAALAMVNVAKPEKKRLISGLLLSAALTAILTGITEPIEFTFLFVAPMLYVVHCILAGLSFMLMHILNISVGMTFSGGIIDLFLFGILQGNERTNWMLIIPIGICYFVVYYFLFKFLILKFNFITPGREELNEESKLYTRKDYEDKNFNLKESSVINENFKEESISNLIIEGLGGKDNIIELSNCATRLRVEVKDTSKIKDEILNQSGALGIVKKEMNIQVIYGPKVTVIKTEIEEYLETL